LHGEFELLPEGTFNDRFDDAPATPNQLRWNPRPIPEAPTDFVDGLYTVAGNG
jgi:homogentisate 1,2-dioxygenase